MTECLSFVIPGDPVAWDRAGRQGDRYFTRGKQQASRDAIVMAWRDAGSLKFPADTALSLSAEFWIPRPKSHYRVGKFSHLLKPDAPHRHTYKPDLDNLTKQIGDALNGFAFKDDAQIQEHHEPYRKCWVPKGCEGMGVTLRALGVDGA